VVKKEQSCTSTPPLRIRGLLRVCQFAG